MCHQLNSSQQKQNFLYKGDEVKGQATVDFSTSCYFDDFLRALNIQPTTPMLVLKCRQVQIHGVQYKEGSVVRLKLRPSSSNPNPYNYGHILSVYVYNEVKFFVCKVYDVVQYDEHFACVQVKESHLNMLVPFNDLYSTGLVSFHITQSMCIVIERDHPHAFLL